MLGFLNTGASVVTLAAVGGVIVTAMLWHSGEVREAEIRGGQINQAKTDRANVQTIQRANRVRAGVYNKRVRGGVDPWAVNN